MKHSKLPDEGDPGKASFLRQLDPRSKPALPAGRLRGIEAEMKTPTMKSEKPPLVLPKSESWKMFDNIARTYDFSNHLISFGLHILWRRKLARCLTSRPDQMVLDLATGTADVLLTLLRHNRNVKYGYGIDPAKRMLTIGRDKVAKKKLAVQINLQHGDAHDVPFKDNHFDAVTMAFGIRNVENPQRVLQEIFRVLNPGGRALILEFSLPKNRFIRNLHLFYLRKGVPFIGALISRNNQAYRYLNQTIEDFPYGEAFCQKIREAGFEKVKAHSLLFGVATIYQGDKA